MSGLWLSRARLRADAPLDALFESGALTDDAASDHRLVWSLFSDGPDRRRDFLWRREPNGPIYALSARPPEAAPLFTVETKPFAPALAEGDQLVFRMAANPVVSRRTDQGRLKRHDVAMAKLYDLPAGDQRAAARREYEQEAGGAWLARQGAAAGFEILAADVTGTRRLKIPRRGAKPAELMRYEFDGRLRIVDPARFLEKLRAGFGKAKAFGLGLMLIRRG